MFVFAIGPYVRAELQQQERARKLFGHILVAEHSFQVSMPNSP